MSGNAAVYYDPEGFDTRRPKLMGRHAAGEGFLRGFARHARVDTLYACTSTEAEYDLFRRMVATAAGERRTAWLPRRQPERLAGPGALFLPGPDLETGAWLRRGHDAAAYSLTGVTHTICTHRVMDAIGALLTAPLEEWDALICTSDAVLRGARHLLEAQAAYLQERLGATRVATPVQLPVIPLGVECDRFQPAETVRSSLRKRHGIGPDDVCVLFFGRLSYHAKAHPLPMYLALEAAAQTSDRKIHLVQAGWFATDGIREAFLEGARELCPSVRMLCVDGRQPDIREGIWQAADIFCSLSDNIQETFGLTPVEAMAAGLPVVASDWDGYRGTVEPGVTGFLVPTAMPPAGAGEGLARRHAAERDNYDHYLGFVCQSVAVDVSATTQAFTDLIGNAALRRRMGEAGRARARQLFDWSVIVARYQELWADLAARRGAATVRGRKPVPLRADPYAVFGHYATRILDGDCRVETTTPDPGARFQQLSRLRINRIGRELLASDADIAAVLERVHSAGGARIGDLLQGVAERERTGWQLTLGWLAKMDLLRVVP